MSTGTVIVQDSYRLEKRVRATKPLKESIKDSTLPKQDKSGKINKRSS